MRPNLTSSFSLIICLSTLLILSNQADGHGVMCEPRQRGSIITAEGRCLYNKDLSLFDANLNNYVIDYCPHCSNGDTCKECPDSNRAAKTDYVPAGGWVIYDPINNIETARQASLCGDEYLTTEHMLGGRFTPSRYENVPIVNVSRTGGTIDFTAQLDSNHNGYFEFYLCDLGACGASDIEEKCFTNGHCHRLERVPHPVCEDVASNKEEFCLPIDPAYPSRWYIPCRKFRYVFGGPSGIMRYKLPDGVVCRHCVVQWYWATGNSCSPLGMIPFLQPMLPEMTALCNALGGEKVAQNFPSGECVNGKIPEEFWSCADIQISADGRSLGSVPIGVVQPPISPPRPSQSNSPVAVAVSSTPLSSPSTLRQPSAVPSKSIVPSLQPSLTPSRSPVAVTVTPSCSPTATQSDSAVDATVSAALFPSASKTPPPVEDECLTKGEIYEDTGVECCSGKHKCRIKIGRGRFPRREIVCYCK